MIGMWTWKSTKIQVCIGSDSACYGSMYGQEEANPGCVMIGYPPSQDGASCIYNPRMHSYWTKHIMWYKIRRQVLANILRLI